MIIDLEIVILIEIDLFILNLDEKREITEVAPYIFFCSIIQ